MHRLDELFEALNDLDTAPGESKATSIRVPEALHRAAQLATELGMDVSFTAATVRALTEHITTFARREALRQHFRRFPSDRPSLAAVAHRRARGSGHAAVRHPQLVEDVAAWVECTRPEWADSGAVDEAVDQVLGYVEMLAANVGVAPQATA